MAVASTGFSGSSVLPAWRRKLRLVLLLVLFGAMASAPPARATTRAGTVPGAATVDLAGMVVDESGQAVVGAEILIYTAHPRVGPSSFCPSCYADCGKHRSSDGSGGFRIQALADWLKFRVYAVREGYEPTILPDIDPKAGPLRVVLRKYTAEYAARQVVQGRILDPAGKPVIAATIEPYARQADNGASQCNVVIGDQPVAITDQQGIYRFHPKYPGHGIYAQVTARGLAEQTVLMDESPGAVTETRMTTGTTITGSLSGPDGKPLADVEIVASWQQTSMQCQFNRNIGIATNDDGHFNLANLPAATRFEVYARIASLGPRDLATGDVSIVSGANDSITPALALRAVPALRVQGSLRMADGSPLPAGTRMLLQRDQLDDAVFADVDTDGRFAFSGAPAGGGVSVGPILRGFRLQTSPTHTAAALPVLASADGTVPPMSLVLVAASPDTSASDHLQIPPPRFVQ